MILDLETVLTSPKAFGLTTASPLQRAICRMIDGKPLGELADRPEVCAAFGGEEAIRALPSNGVGPRRVTILAGIRTGKTLIAAACAVRSSQTLDLTHLRAGEVPRTSVIAPKMDLAVVALNHVRGSIEASPLLRQLIVGGSLKESIHLRHPSKRPVEIKVSAAASGGTALVSRWAGDVIIDEAPRWSGNDENVKVTLEDTRTAGMGRLLGQWIEIGSPWISGGPVHKDFVEHFGKPSDQLVVVKAPAYAMWPERWTPELCEKVRLTDARTYQTDILANFIDDDSLAFDADAAAHMFEPPSAQLYSVGNAVVIADPSGLRGDGWIWCVARWCEMRGSDQPYLMLNGYDEKGNITIRDATPMRDKDGRCVPNPAYGKTKRVLVVTDVEAGSGSFIKDGPSAIRRIVSDVAATARRNGATKVFADQYSASAYAAMFQEHRIHYEDVAWTQANKTIAVNHARALMRDRSILIRAGQHTDTIKSEIARYREKLQQSGASSFGAAGRAHDDFVSCCILGAAFADASGDLRGSTMVKGSTRIEYGSGDFSFG